MRTSWNLGNGKFDGFNSEIFKVGSSPPLPQRALPSLELSSTGDSCRRLGDESHNCENPSHCFHWVECVISFRCQKEVVAVSFPEPPGKEELVSGWVGACLHQGCSYRVCADPHPRSSLCSVLNYCFSLKYWSLFVSSLLARPSDDGRERKQTHPEKL